MEPPRPPKVYVSGPMTGLPGLNFPAFKAQAEALARLGFEPLNPAENGVPAGAPREAHMRADLLMLLRADAVFLLPGYENSRGASAEILTAGWCGIPLFLSNHAIFYHFRHRLADCRPDPNDPATNPTIV